MFERPDRVRAGELWIVTMVSNPVRFRSRWKLYEDFAHVVERAGAKLMTVEVAYGDRMHVLQSSACLGGYLPLRTRHELWHKENALNLGFQRLPDSWRYAGWFDADINFARGDWADETVHQLQHHPIVQPWSAAVDLDPNYEIIKHHRSFAWSMQNEEEIGHGPDLEPASGGSADPRRPTINHWHPGYAWAIRREAFDALGGLPDYCIIGNADYFAARAVAGRQFEARGLGPVANRWLQEFAARAQRVIRQDVGYVSGTLIHHWHGKKADRKYQERDKILSGAGFNPELDLVRDAQGLWQLTDRSPALRDGIRGYFRARNEDNIDV